jgi:3-dehydroquinate synthase class II
LLKKDQQLYHEISDLIQLNSVILDDNAVEYSLGEADEYISETADIKNGLDVSAAALLKDAGFPDTVYLGIIENSIHKEEAVNYIRYLFQFE